ncbi:MAG TPA: FixH family protein [Actinomycetota bacterium]|nr:FixH family protein [Actinomycetota bacterium]
MRYRFAAVLAAVILSAGPAAAHETKPAGPLRVAVGWSTEPPYAGLANAVEVTVTDAAGRPATDASLNVVVTFGPRSSSALPLAATPGTPGRYAVTLVPTRPGDYAFRVTGQAAGQAVDLNYTSREKMIEPVLSSGSAQFPSREPSAAELASRTQRLSSRVDSALADAARARLETKVVAVAALLALVLSVVSLRRRKTDA